MSLLEKYKLSYIAYSKTKTHQNRVERAKNLICEVLSSHKKPYIAFSGGKDSLCLLDLVITEKPDIKVMHHDSGVELPETKEVIKKIEDNWGINLEIIKNDVDVLDYYKKTNEIFQAGHYNDSVGDIVIRDVIKKWTKENEYDLAFLGLRKEEGRKRRILLCKRGNYFYSSNMNIWECMPLSDWKKEDVWAYIFSHYPLENLIHPAYYKDKLVKDPGDIRVSWWCDTTMANKGYFVWLKIYYPELFKQLQEKFPEVNTYY